MLLIFNLLIMGLLLNKIQILVCELILQDYPDHDFLIHEPPVKTF
jgi:hypothetical protein